MCGRGRRCSGRGRYRCGSGRKEGSEAESEDQSSSGSRSGKGETSDTLWSLMSTVRTLQHELDTTHETRYFLYATLSTDDNSLFVTAEWS